MKIEVWSDFVCPFCYIGKRRLESALGQFAHRDEVAIEYRSFELNPQAEVYSGKSMHQMLSEKHGMSLDEAKRANAQIVQQAAIEGLEYNFDQMKPTNTFDAHRFMHYSKTVGKDKEVTEKLYYSYYTESKLLSDHDTLADIAEAIGMDREDTLTVLRDPFKYANDVRVDEATAKKLGIAGAPFFVIDRKYAVSGAQPTEVFLKALNQAF